MVVCYILVIHIHLLTSSISTVGTALLLIPKLCKMLSRASNAFCWLAQKATLLIVCHFYHHKFKIFMGSFEICEICYFTGLYCVNTNVVHYLNTKVVCVIFMCKQHK